MKVVPLTSNSSQVNPRSSLGRDHEAEITVPFHASCSDALSISTFSYMGSFRFREILSRVFSVEGVLSYTFDSYLTLDFMFIGVCVVERKRWHFCVLLFNGYCINKRSNETECQQHCTTKHVTNLKKNTNNLPKG